MHNTLLLSMYQRTVLLLDKKLDNSFCEKASLDVIKAKLKIPFVGCHKITNYSLVKIFLRRA